MSKDSAIQWTNHTHNFWYGCQKVSPGCKFCYAERDMTRYGLPFGKVARAKGFDKPLSWKEPALVFVNSWSDFFHEAADEWRDEAWDIIRRTPHLTYQILTKRPKRISQCLPDDWRWDGWPNVWLGVSIEEDGYIWRVRELLNIPAIIHFVSAEPLLGEVSFRHEENEIDGVEWVIVGGESGPGARPMNLDWARSLRDECVEAGVAYFFKQVGGNTKINGAWGGRELDGRTWDEMPEPAGQMRLF